MSPQKNYKLKPILIALQTSFWSVKQILMKCDAISDNINLSATLRPTLRFNCSKFRCHFECFFLEPFFYKSKDWLPTNRISVKTYSTISTSIFLTQTLPTAVHSFLYVHIRFRTFTIAIRPTSNNFYDITNVPTTLYLSRRRRTSVFFFLPCWSSWFLFTKQIITVLSWVIYSYLQKLFKIGVLCWSFFSSASNLQLF